MKKIFISLFILIIIGIFAAFGGYNYYNYKINTKQTYDVTVEINSSASLRKAFKTLEVDNDNFFKVYLNYERNAGRNIKAGYYEFKGNFSYNDIMTILEEGREKYTPITIPEGFSLKEIGALLESKGVGSYEGLLNALSNVKDFPYPTPNNNFEGYLYPETYFLSGDITEEKVVKRMLDEFLKRFPSEKYPNKKKFYEQLILASIIDREAQISDEKPLMASVFYNRLKKKMRLGSDATVNYLYDYKKKRMFYKDLEIDSPYNTYKYGGLPPAPISNPDEESMQAAMNPAETDYLFFVATGGGRHTFTKTYKEHLEVQKKK